MTVNFDINHTAYRASQKNDIELINDDIIMLKIF